MQRIMAKFGIAKLSYEYGDVVYLFDSVFEHFSKGEYNEAIGALNHVRNEVLSHLNYQEDNEAYIYLSYLIEFIYNVSGKEELRELALLRLFKYANTEALQQYGSVRYLQFYNLIHALIKDVSNTDDLKQEIQQYQLLIDRSDPAVRLQFYGIIYGLYHKYDLHNEAWRVVNNQVEVYESNPNLFYSSIEILNEYRYQKLINQCIHHDSYTDLTIPTFEHPGGKKLNVQLYKAASTVLLEGMQQVYTQRAIFKKMMKEIPPGALSQFYDICLYWLKNFKKTKFKKWRDCFKNKEIIFNNYNDFIAHEEAIVIITYIESIVKRIKKSDSATYNAVV
jgi:hypothetical protein